MNQEDLQRAEKVIQRYHAKFNRDLRLEEIERILMGKRYKMSKGSSKRKFKKNAGTNRMNTKPRPMRGGTRL